MNNVMKTLPGLLKSKPFDLIFNKTDIQGNKLEYIETNLFLTLKADGKRRNIGTITIHPDNKILYTKHETNGGIFRKTNAWSIHNYILHNVEYIIYYTETKIYKITAEVAKTKGSYLFFKQKGYELKIYVPLKYWWCDDNLS
jgi:hypothetical protein